jgi:hypothetical protein
MVQRGVCSIVVMLMMVLLVGVTHSFAVPVEGVVDPELIGGAACREQPHTLSRI